MSMRRSVTAWVSAAVRGQVAQEGASGSAGRSGIIAGSWGRLEEE